VVSLRRILDFLIPGLAPLPGVVDHSGAHHVQVDVRETARKVFVRLDDRRMIEILPEGGAPPLAGIACARPGA
jgi:hypothetical protein